MSYKDVKLNFGDELTPTQVRDPPQLSWNAIDSNFYTVAIIG